MKTHKTNSFEMTRKVGADFAKQLHGGEVLLLRGELGAGKTTFMQGLATGLGIAKNILSPTFIIMRSYPLSSHKTLYHVDLYRMENESDIRALGLLELLHDPDSIVAIEWPEKMGELLPKNSIAITIAYAGENEREITIV